MAHIHWPDTGGFAMRRFALLACTLLLATTTALAQKNPVSDAARSVLERYAKNIPAAVEQMPADKFSYKPTDGQITFGHLVLHTVEANNLFCSKLSGQETPKVTLKDDAPKEQLVTALKSSFDFCTAALPKLEDSQLNEEVTAFGDRKMTKALLLLSMTGNLYDHYGAMSIYLRLNGQLPPTAQPKK